MTVGNDTVKTNLVEVRCLELKHLVDTGAVYFIRCLANFVIVTLTTEACGDQLLAVLVQQIKCWPMCASRDLDELCEAISDLSLWKSPQETKVEECVHGCMVGTQSVLVVAVVDTDLDADTGVDQTNDGGGDTDVVGGSSVCSTSKPVITS